MLATLAAEGFLLSDASWEEERPISSARAAPDASASTSATSSSSLSVASGDDVCSFGSIDPRAALSLAT